MTYTIQEAVARVQEAVFKRIQEENQGEFTEEEFNVILYDIVNDECDYYSTSLQENVLEAMILEYGLRKAIQLAVFDNGPHQTAPDSWTIVYFILQDKVYFGTTFASYTQYVNENPL